MTGKLEECWGGVLMQSGISGWRRFASLLGVTRRENEGPLVTLKKISKNGRVPPKQTKLLVVEPLPGSLDVTQRQLSSYEDQLMERKRESAHHNKLIGSE
jgi:hypothetical protein